MSGRTTQAVEDLVEEYNSNLNEFDAHIAEMVVKEKKRVEEEIKH